jgi:ribonuclease PH
MAKAGVITRVPLSDHVAAVSCGVVGGEAVLDLDYAEDSSAETDANFVLTGKGGLVEVQASAEKEPFDETLFNRMLALARQGAAELVAAQKRAIDAG